MFRISIWCLGQARSLEKEKTYIQNGAGRFQFGTNFDYAIAFKRKKW